MKYNVEVIKQAKNLETLESEALTADFLWFIAPVRTVHQSITELLVGEAREGGPTGRRVGRTLHGYSLLDVARVDTCLVLGLLEI